jgi:hypothetical protein
MCHIHKCDLKTFSPTGIQLFYTSLYLSKSGIIRKNTFKLWVTFIKTCFYVTGIRLKKPEFMYNLQLGEIIKCVYFNEKLTSKSTNCQQDAPLCDCVSCLAVKSWTRLETVGRSRYSSLLNTWVNYINNFYLICLCQNTITLSWFISRVIWKTNTNFEILL